MFTGCNRNIMESELSHLNAGKKLASIRKAKGYSQAELAKMVKISRPSLTQIELGNRGIDIIELQRFSNVLGFSMDEFLTTSNENNGLYLLEEGAEKNILEERNPVPKLHYEKSKNVLLYILGHCAGKPNVGETVLYKLLYFCDFNYYELYEDHLTGIRYRKLPFGPVPQKLDVIIQKMMTDGLLQRIKTTYHGLAQTRYLPLEKPDLTKLQASEIDVINKVMDQMSDWSASMISEYSHKDLPWEVTDNGKEISYELAFYRELPYTVRIYDDEIDQDL
jgi:transcriptional regulator with XRE-family HTH domain